MTLRSLRCTLVVALVCLTASSVPSPPASAAQPSAPRDAEPHSRVRFEANAGQTAPEVRFVSRIGGSRAFLTASSLVLARSGGSVSMDYVGASIRAAISGEGRLPGHVNYVRGNDPSRWQLDVASFERVRYREIYPAVDLVYYGENDELEFDFVVAPGGDPGAIAVAFRDAESLSVDASGALTVRAEGTELKLERPAIYQDTPDGRRRVAGAFRIDRDRRVGFEVAEYDRRYPLVIDPVLVYSTTLGGSLDEKVSDLAIDASGRGHIVGTTTSVDFPGLDRTSTFWTDAFAARLSATGSSIEYVTLFGGAFHEEGHGISVDADGDAVVVGSTGSADFPTVAPFQAMNGGARDAFVAKLGPTGAPIWSTFLGGSNSEEARDIAVDADGNVYVTGYTTSPNFPLKDPFQSLTITTLGQAFVTKLTSQGSALVYSTHFGGTVEATTGQTIAVDSLGQAVLAGTTAIRDLPLVNPTQTAADVSRFDGHGFVAKFNASGSALVFSTYLGGNSKEELHDADVDASGNVWVTGQTGSTNFILLNPLQTDPDGGSLDAFVTKFDATGELLFSTLLGGTRDDIARAITLDATGNAHVTGQTSSLDFPEVDPLQANPDGFSNDVFVATIDATATSLLFSTYFGGTGVEVGYTIEVDAAGHIFVGGYTYSLDFPEETPAQSNPNTGPFGQGFLSKIAVESGGRDTVGVYLPPSGVFFLRDRNSAGPADATFGYGPSNLGWIAVDGDWNGDGTDTLGLYDPQSGFFFLRNQNAPGPADEVFGFGPGSLGWVPLAGDWDGDGDDTPGLYDPGSGVFFLRNENAPGPADATFGFGPPGLGWQPLVGDWNGDGTDTIGLYAPASGTFFLRNANAPGAADLTFGFGPAGLGWRPLAGDFNGDGRDTVGLYDAANGIFYLRNANAPGAADATFGYGPADATPLVGDWNGA